jgi:N-acetylglucosaminyl-diphospho-decaprenol L-rhamnosyltransferase
MPNEPTPSVSVVIPHYGSPAPAAALVDQLLANHTPLLREIIVVDDASPEPFPERDNVRVVRRPTNGGFGAAVNAGAGLATSELLLVMNSDLAIPADFVAALTAAAQPWLPAVVSPFVVNADGSNAKTGRHFPTVRHQTLEWLTPLARWRPRLREALGHDTRVARGATTTVDWAFGACLLIPAADFAAVGGFDERFFMNGEEIDLQRRLRNRGLVTVVVGDVTITHGNGASSDPALRRSWLVESQMTYAAKWGSPGVLKAALVAATFANFVWNTCRRVAGRPVTPWKTARQELRLLNSKPR